MENYAAKTAGDLMTYVQEEVIPEIRRLMELAGKANNAKGELNFSLHLDNDGYATYSVYTDEGEKLPNRLYAYKTRFNSEWQRNPLAEKDPWEAIRT